MPEGLIPILLNTCAELEMGLNVSSHMKAPLNVCTNSCSSINLVAMLPGSTFFFFVLSKISGQSILFYYVQKSWAGEPGNEDINSVVL